MNSTPLISLRDVGFNFGRPSASHRFVMKGISVDFQCNKIVALLGPSGIGKSTILRVAAGLLQPTEGAVFRAKDVPLGAATVFQNARLIPWLNVRENIRFASAFHYGPDDNARLASTIQRLGLLSAAGLRPHELSGGMKQRCSFARAILSKHPFLVLDEPFNGTDFLLREVLYKLLDEEAQGGRAIVLVTHDIQEAVRLADLILVLGGFPTRILERFEPGELAYSGRQAESSAINRAENELRERIASAFQAVEMGEE